MGVLISPLYTHAKVDRAAGPVDAWEMIASSRRLMVDQPRSRA